jgi:hypothetical protein
VRPGLWAGKSLHPYRSVEAEPTGALSGEYVRGPEGALSGYRQEACFCADFRPTQR